MTFLADVPGTTNSPKTGARHTSTHPTWTMPPAGCRDLEGLDPYVNECAERLWTPEARDFGRWSTATGGIPRDLSRSPHLAERAARSSVN
jgi:hypothetical protein